MFPSLFFSSTVKGERASPLPARGRALGLQSGLTTKLDEPGVRSGKTPVPLSLSFARARAGGCPPTARVKRPRPLRVAKERKLKRESATQGTEGVAP